MLQNALAALGERVVGHSASSDSTAAPSPPLLAPEAPPLLTSAYIFEHAVQPFVERLKSSTSQPTFSLLELGSWSGLYAVAIGEQHPQSTLVSLEPDKKLSKKHAEMARARRIANVAIADNPMSEAIAEALAHSNEFFDGALLLSLHTAKPFDHGSRVTAEHLLRFDKFVGQLLSLARSSLLLLPSASLSATCRDNRLANWVYSGLTYTNGSSFSRDRGIPGRLSKAGASVGMRLHTRRLLEGMAADGCGYRLGMRMST